MFFKLLNKPQAEDVSIVFVSIVSSCVISYIDFIIEPVYSIIIIKINLYM